MSKRNRTRTRGPAALLGRITGLMEGSSKKSVTLRLARSAPKALKATERYARRRPVKMAGWATLLGSLFYMGRRWASRGASAESGAPDQSLQTGSAGMERPPYDAMRPASELHAAH